jgi:hypothetical protein
MRFNETRHALLGGGATCALAAGFSTAIAIAYRHCYSPSPHQLCAKSLSSHHARAEAASNHSTVVYIHICSFEQ